MAKASIDLTNAIYAIAEAMQPITGRGVGYKLFVAGLIPSMGRNDMRKVYRLLLLAREQGRIPWEWIVDETRRLEQVASWKDDKAFMRDAGISYRRSLWRDQPCRVEVWSEKGTVRGVLAPVIDDEFGVGFRPVHGFCGATAVNEVAASDDGRPLKVLYVGDYDPSGMCMSEADLPKRFARYGGCHVSLKRIALVKDDLPGLPSFPASDKKKDPRYPWFVKHYGTLCWELDAMDPNELRARVREAILAEIEPDAWARGLKAEEAEQESLRAYFQSYKGLKPKVDTPDDGSTPGYYGA